MIAWQYACRCGASHSLQGCAHLGEWYVHLVWDHDWVHLLGLLLTDLLCCCFWCDHIFWFLRDLILRPSWDPAWRRMESQFCFWVLAVLGSQSFQREVVSDSDNHWHSLTVLHLSEAHEKTRTVYIFHKAEFIQNCKARSSMFRLHSFVLCVCVCFCTYMLFISWNNIDNSW